VPLFDFLCKDCKFAKEHFVYAGGIKPKCPECGSDSYYKLFSKFRVDVKYANTTEYMQRKMMPEIQELYAQIGKEAINEDSKTLDNIFGEQKVSETYGEPDD
jgi:putative FmdB family regulatory protein